MDVTIKVPVSLCTEVGTPLSSEVVVLIRAMEVMGYWPFDFGEATDEYVELCFIQGKQQEMVKRVVDYFIRKHGDV